MLSLLSTAANAAMPKNITAFGFGYSVDWALVTLLPGLGLMLSSGFTARRTINEQDRTSARKAWSKMRLAAVLLLLGQLINAIGWVAGGYKGYAAQACDSAPFGKARETDGEAGKANWLSFSVCVKNTSTAIGYTGDSCVACGEKAVSRAQVLGGQFFTPIVNFVINMYFTYLLWSYSVKLEEGALEAGLDEEVVYVLRMAGDPAGTRRDIKGATADEKKYGFVKPSIGALMSDPNFDAWWANALKHQAVNQATHKQGVASQPVSEPGPSPAPMPATPGVESFHGQPASVPANETPANEGKGPWPVDDTGSTDRNLPGAIDKDGEAK